jgi:hypothetical protein
MLIFNVDVILWHCGPNHLDWDMIFTRVGTYVQRGSKFCFVVLVLVVADTLIRLLHFRPISPCFQHIIAPLHTALPGSLARASLAAFCALAGQPWVRLHGSCCPDKSEQVQQNITPDTSTGFDACARARARSLHNHRTVLQWQVTKLHARAAVLTGLNLFLVQFHHAFIICTCGHCCPADRLKLVQFFLCRPIAPYA